MNTGEKDLLRKRWGILCHRLNESSRNCGLDAKGIEKWWQILDQHYSEPHRAYHTWEHIDFCLREFDKVVHLFRSPLAAELALFFHDAVYEIDPIPKPFQNEMACAGLLGDFCKEIGISTVFAQLVNCTDHDPYRLPTMTNDEKLICSIDLAVLSGSRMNYFVYSHSIRQEYKAVPLDVYRSKRAEILEGFLKRERIFLANDFYRFEPATRDNLAWEINVLRAGQFPQT